MLCYGNEDHLCWVMAATMSRPACSSTPQRTRGHSLTRSSLVVRAEHATENVLAGPPCSLWWPWCSELRAHHGLVSYRHNDQSRLETTETVDGTNHTVKERQVHRSNSPVLKLRVKSVGSSFLPRPPPAPSTSRGSSAESPLLPRRANKKT